MINAGVAAIPSQFKVTQQILFHWQPFRDLKLKYVAHRRDESWSASLWQTFFSTSMGAQIPVIAEKPLAACGCKKFPLDPLGDHLNTCTVHSGAKKAQTGWLINLLTFSVQHIKLKHNRSFKVGVSIVGTSS